MKTIILFAILAVSFSANAQSLKELLYSGKLKSDTGTTVKKTDDLSTKIDTSTRKVVVAEPMKPTPVVRDPSITGIAVDTSAALSNVEMTTDSTGAKVPVAATGPRDNNRIWKDYIDSITTGLRTEVMTSKKVKSGVYSVLIEYEIGLDGQTTINSVSASPESSYLEQQVKERLMLTSPQMIPLIGTNGKGRKAIKKQTITLTKG